MRNFLVLSFCCLWAFGCTSPQMPGDIQAALTANEELYKKSSGGLYDAIYYASTDEFKANVGRGNVTALLKRVNQASIGCGPATLVLTSYQLNGELIDLTYTRKCRASGDITEKFSWKIAHSRPMLNSYIVDGPGLHH